MRARQEGDRVPSQGGALRIADDRRGGFVE
jgi:hypothetical protein